jgi:phospholipid-binding lipoprotein MlaA
LLAGTTGFIIVIRDVLVKNFKKVGECFLVMFLVLGLSSFSSANDTNYSSNLSYHFVNETGEDVYVQTSEVTIKLEKSIPRSSSFPVDTAQGITKPFEYSDPFEDLEDPFAGDTEDLPVMSDPFEGYNRWMFDVNDTIYDSVLEPVARGYRDAIHQDLRMGIKNFFSNLMSPVKLVSSLIQLDFEKTGRVLVRVLINTTFGIGGLADVAGEEYGIHNVNEDMDQALGSYGVPTGPYIVLPFFGPSTARNVIGSFVDSFMKPTFFLDPGVEVTVGITVEENINSASFIVDDKKELEAGALDEYESMRDFYHQYRHSLLKK